MADKVVQLVDKNSNNLYPVAGAAITDAISTGAISSQAVTSAKIANGNVTGVANNATVVGNTQLALDTVGTPNLRNQSVTSQKIDWETFQYAEACRRTNFTYPSNTNYAQEVIPMDTLSKANGFTLSSDGSLVCQVAGTYAVSARMMFLKNNPNFNFPHYMGLYIGIRHNGIDNYDRNFFQTFVNESEFCTPVTTVDLSVGDQVSLSMKANPTPYTEIIKTGTYTHRTGITLFRIG